MRSIATITLFCISSLVLAQSTNVSTLFHGTFRKAEHYFEKMYYRNALDLYHQEWEKRPHNQQAIARMAECYQFLEDTKSAEIWYRKLAEEGEVDPLHKYEFAEVLMQNNKYDEAKGWYEAYAADVPEDSRPGRKLEILNNLGFYFRDSALYIVELLNINTRESDFGALQHGNGIVFLSARDQDLLIKHQAPTNLENMIDLYYSDLSEDGSFNIPIKFHSEINTKYHEGPLTFAPDGKTVIFTRNNYHQGTKKTSSDRRVKLKLYTAVLDEKNDWTRVREFPHNSDEYSTAHPSWNETGHTLYFSSDMPGGFGGSDLYKVHFENGEWGAPQNLGSVVNTEGDEMFPFISKDSVLYFSSDGQGGLGGLDNFISIKTPDGTFEQVLNLGYPINTHYDDFGIVTDEFNRTGYLSSNREGGTGGDDIYKFSLKYILLAGEVKQLASEEPLKNVSISLTKPDGELVNKTESTETGQFFFDLPFNTGYLLDAEVEGYSMVAQNQISTIDKYKNIDSVVVYMWKHELFAEGRIFSNEEQALLPYSKVTIYNLTDDVKDSVTVSTNATYSFVVQTGKKYRIEASKDKYITDGFNLNTEGLEKGRLLNDIVLEEDFIDKSVVFFDYNKYRVRTDAAVELDRVIKIMKRFKDTKLVISAHADSFGTREYNQRLSDLRAEAVVDFIISKGISRDRITARGFGEELLINTCSDGVECPDIEHSKNRRAEIKIERESQ